MTPQQLKNSILQLAIQVKIVEQRPEEGSGQELFNQIQEEKQKLIAEGKIKKEKALAPITEEEIPFEVPENWTWVKLRNICSKIVDGDHNPPKGESKPTPFYMISAQNVINNDLNLDNVRYLSLEQFEEENKRTLLKKGDILLTIVGTLGRSCVYNKNYNLAFQRSVSVITTLIFNEYLKSVFDSPFIQDAMNTKATGTAQKGFYLKQLENLLIPLPPLEEQKRIVSKIEELLPYVDKYQEYYDELESLNSKFPGQLRKSILQYAIEGKLVEQRPEEGTGQELFNQIQEEKQKLIAEGKIKKEKALTPISDEEIPFDIPVSWRWCRLGKIIEIKSSKRVFEKDYVLEGIPFYRSKEIGELSLGKTILSKSLYISKEHFSIIRENYGIPKEGDIFLTSVGTIGNCWISDGREFYYKDGNITQLCSSININSNYVAYFIKSPIFSSQVSSKVSGTAYNALTIIKLNNLIFPLPPLAEQKRIVAKVEELFKLCDKLDLS